MKTNEAHEFLNALSEGAQTAERLIFCGFAGDPNAADVSAWRPRPWKRGDLLPIDPTRTNGYITQASFRRAPDGTWRRRKDLFAHGLAFMVDDVHTKVDPAVVSVLRPSAIVETSPGNEQWWYFLARPEPGRAVFDALIKAFIDQRLLGNDPGMSGVTRVGRVPGYINGKAAYAGFRTRLVELNDNRFEIDEIKAAFNLKPRLRRRARTAVPRDAEDRIERFRIHRNWLALEGLLKRDAPNLGGWTEITCPWHASHSERADTGAAISEPNPENEWNGGFRCHHGSCIDRDWGDLTQFISDGSADLLESVNAMEAGDGSDHAAA